jgi:hypothetical protein
VFPLGLDAEGDCDSASAAASRSRSLRLFHNSRKY